MVWVKKNKQLIILVLIIIVGACLRLYRLGEIPALNADEAALGYNAYSLLKTGLDEHGNKWPLYFQSFNDYKPGFTAYLMMPTIFLFGLNEWSVRVIPALIAIFTIPVLYLLAKEITRDSKIEYIKRMLPLTVALFISVSPWHIHFSRGAWEVNIATFFMCLGALFFLQSKYIPNRIILSCFAFVLSLYTYHAARIVAPLIVISLAILNRESLLKGRKNVAVAIIVGVVLCLPLISSLRSPAGLARAGGVAIWADSGPENRVNELRGNYENMNGFLPRLLHNKPVAYTLAILQNWSKHYWGEFLFLSGDDIQRNKVPETGQMHLIEFFFVGVGLYIILRKLDKHWSFILIWLGVAAIPAAITFQAPHALRAESMVIPLTFISSYGFVYLVYYFWKNIPKLAIFSSVLITSLFFVSVSRYVHMYYVHMSKEYPFSSQYGLKELVSFLSPIHEKYSNVVITDRYDQPYILFLFYMKYDPASFQKDHTLTDRDSYGFSTVRSFSNFKFESIPYEEAIARYPNSLLIGTEKEILPEANILTDIYGTNGYRYFRVVAN